MAGKLGRKIYATKLWKRKRLEIFERDGWRCSECGKAGRLECHHVEKITSARLWFDNDNLATICRGCHIEKSRQEKKEREKEFMSDRRKIMYEMAGV